MDLRKLKTLLELFENSNLEEMEFCEGEERIRLKKPGADSPAVAPPPAATVAAAASVAPAPAADAPLLSGGTAEAPVHSGTVVKAPMVGTFYRAPAPDKPPFVRVGQRVEKGETLCFIEAMKLMNEIPAPISGEIREILAENGEPVAFGNKLFVIE